MIKTSDRRVRFDERNSCRSTLEILGVAPMAQCPIGFETTLLASDSSWPTAATEILRGNMQAEYR